MIIISIIINIIDLSYLYLIFETSANINDINVQGIIKLSGIINAKNIDNPFVIKQPRAKL